MTTEPTRYTPGSDDVGDPNYFEDDEGMFVRYTDFAALKAERDALREALRRIANHDRCCVDWRAADEFQSIARKALTTPGPTP